MEERLPVVAALFFVLASPVAFAGPIAEPLAAVRASLDTGDAKAALAQLEDIEAGLGALTEVVPQQELARIHYLRGAAYFQHPRHRKKGRHTDAWRAALAIDNTFSWDRELIASSDAFRLFEALRGEVRSRGYHDTGVPEATGAAQIFVDGVRHRDGDQVIALGQHLAQITCPDEQGTFTFLTDFSTPPDWFGRCPDGVDTSVVVEEEDEWSSFGPAISFSDAPQPQPTPEDPQPTPEEPEPTPVDSAPGSDVQVISGSLPGAAVTPEEDPDPEPAQEAPVVADATGGKGFGTGGVLMTSGGALLVGGIALNFAVVAPTFAEIEAAREDPEGIRREEADALTQRFNVARTGALVMLGAGVALGGAGLFIDAPVRPSVGWRSVHISVHF